MLFKSQYDGEDIQRDFDDVVREYAEGEEFVILCLVRLVCVALHWQVRNVIIILILKKKDY